MRDYVGRRIESSAIKKTARTVLYSCETKDEWECYTDIYFHHDVLSALVMFVEIWFRKDEKIHLHPFNYSFSIFIRNPFLFFPQQGSDHRSLSHCSFFAVLSGYSFTFTVFRFDSFSLISFLDDVCFVLGSGSVWLVG